jgi:phosphate-selective porin OprO and OprP
MRRMVLVTFLIAQSVAAQTDIESRLKALEEQVAQLKALQQEVAQLKAENELLRRDLGLEVTQRQAAVKSTGNTANLQFGGFIQAQAESGQPVDARFPDDRPRLYLRRARMNASGRFLDAFNFRTELELAGSLGAASAVRAQMTDAYITWTQYDLANIRVGQFKSPFGFEQLYQDPRLYTVERSLVNDRLTLGRQIGAQLSGGITTDRFNYAIGAFNGNGINITTNDNNQLMYVARAGVTPVLTTVSTNVLRVTTGVNAYSSEDANVSLGPEFGLQNNLFTGRRRGAGIDAQALIGPVELWGEYLKTSFEPTSRAFKEFKSDGWYAQAMWLTFDSHVQLVGRYDNFTAVEDRVAGKHTLTLGANYLFRGDDLKFQINWLRTQHDNRILARLQTIF